MKHTVVTAFAIAVLLTGALADAEWPRAADHLVSLSAVRSRLSQSGSQRDADLAEVRSVLVSPEVSAAIARVGLDGRALREQAAILSDEDLQDLAQRAALLRADPTAGSVAKTTPLVLVAVAVILIVVLIVSIHHQLPS